MRGKCEFLIVCINQVALQSDTSFCRLALCAFSVKSPKTKIHYPLLASHLRLVKTFTLSEEDSASYSLPCMFPLYVLVFVGLSVNQCVNVYIDTQVQAVHHWP